MTTLQITFLVVGIIALIGLIPLIYFFIIKINDWKMERARQGFETNKKSMLGSVHKPFQIWLWILIIFFLVLTLIFCIAMFASGIK